MRLRVFVLAAALLANTASISIALVLRGRLTATLDGKRLRTRDARHFIDEGAGTYVVTSCIRHIKAPETGYTCLHVIRIRFDLTAGATGTVPCEYARYETYPSGDPTADTVVWETFAGFGGGCSVEIRKNVADRFDRAGRLRGTFAATVSPSLGQGGPDREIEGKFWTRLFDHGGD